MIKKRSKIGLVVKVDLKQFRGYLKVLFLVWAMVTAICDLKEVIG